MCILITKTIKAPAKPTIPSPWARCLHLEPLFSFFRQLYLHEEPGKKLKKSLSCNSLKQWATLRTESRLCLPERRGKGGYESDRWEMTDLTTEEKECEKIRNRPKLVLRQWPVDNIKKGCINELIQGMTLGRCWSWVQCIEFSWNFS